MFSNFSEWFCFNWSRSCRSHSWFPCSPGSLTDDPETQSANYVLFFGLSISIGVFLAGWLALRFHWLKSQPLLLPRLIGTVLGAYLPLVVVLLIETVIRAGHPVFTIALFTGILGFHLPAWLKRKPA